jgi:DNA-binding MarR family transcriptional regulator/N-acetylglutamate synthase-like GNAT family acetyltransferase
MPASPAPERIDAARAFTRLYTNKIGVLRGGLHGSRHPLPEARVLFELGRAERTDVADLRHALDMDAGQLSRLLARLDDDGLITRERSAADARRQVLRLTAAGRGEFERLDRGAIEQWAQLLAGVPDAEQRRLLGAMGAVREVLDGVPAPEASDVVLRDLRPGDYGWIVARHGVLYFHEYGWGLGFEALVARVVADFAEQEQEQRFRRGWIAEVDGAPAGCILSVDGDQEGDAKLRLLLVEPWARGLGVGGRLIDAVVDHARERGARRVVLWTNHPLVEARRLYERRGFTLIAEEPHADWGVPLTGQVLALEL